MPNAPRPDNPVRAIRVDDELWSAARSRAAELGEPLSEAIRRFLRTYAE